MKKNSKKKSTDRSMFEAKHCFQSLNNKLKLYEESVKKNRKKTTTTKAIKSYIFTEPRCGPIGAAISLPVAPCDVDAPQPLVDRRPSVSMLKWGSYHKRNDALTPTAARQGSTKSLSLFILLRYIFCFIFYFNTD